MPRNTKPMIERNLEFRATDTADDGVLEILQTHMSFYVDSSGMACELSDRMPDYPAEEEPSWVALVSNAFIALDWLAKTFPNDVRVIDDWSPYVERDAALFRWVGEPSE